MSRKNTLEPVRLSTAQSLAANFNSAATLINYLDNVAYQINVTTTNSTGTVVVEVSSDYVPTNDPLHKANSGIWAALTLDGTPTVAAANDSIVISLNQLPYKAIRLAYSSSIAGTGTADIYITAKAV